MILNKRRIEILMASKCLTSCDLANSAGVDYSTISRGFNWEKYKNELKPITVGKIARALEVNVEDIILDEQ